VFEKRKAKRLDAKKVGGGNESKKKKEKRLDNKKVGEEMK
jgi:hypothetical protein